MSADSNGNDGMMKLLTMLINIVMMNVAMIWNVTLLYLDLSTT